MKEINGGRFKGAHALDCQECFDKRWRMCTLKNGNSMMDYTRSSNKGDGVCCNPDEDGCKTDSRLGLYCSEPPLLDENKTFENITSLDRTMMFEKAVNYQLFAFCPATTQKKCKINRSSSQNMKIYADDSD